MSCAQREVHDNHGDKVDAVEAALLHMTEMVAEISRKLDAVIKHLKVPYNPPADYIKE